MTRKRKQCFMQASDLTIFLIVFCCFLIFCWLQSFCFASLVFSDVGSVFVWREVGFKILAILFSEKDFFSLKNCIK